MTKILLRTASVLCLAIWGLIWLAFLVMRFSTLEIRQVPSIGIIMLSAFAVALATPILATGFAAAGLVRHPRTPRDTLIFGCAVAALLGQIFLFLITRWL
jgi:purine-cytosine permease-like protein